MSKYADFFVKYPFFKGVAAYSILWPAANILYQVKNPTQKGIDLLEVIRYGAVGVTFVLPVYYTWMKVINRLVPAQDNKTIFKKLIMEQTLYWPVSITAFFAGMNFYHGQSIEHFQNELNQKYLKTHLAGLCFWPYVSPLINYSNLIKDHNRAPLIAGASFLWVTYLSYVKGQDTNPTESNPTESNPTESNPTESSPQPVPEKLAKKNE